MQKERPSDSEVDTQSEFPPEGSIAAKLTEELEKKEAVDAEKAANRAAKKATAPKKIVAAPKPETKVKPTLATATPEDAEKKARSTPKKRAQKIHQATQMLKEAGVSAVATSSKRKKVTKSTTEKESTVVKKAKKEKSAKKNPYAGKSIKVLDKANPYRDGSDRAIRFNIIIASKTVDDAMGKVTKGQSVSARDVARAVKKHCIKLI